MGLDWGSGSAGMEQGMETERHMAALWPEGDPATGDPAPAGDPAAWSPGWSADMARFGPWLPGSFPGPGAGRRLACAVAARVVPGGPVLICGRASSALDVAWRLHGQGLLPQWASVLAAGQWAGRGQMRRQWRSPLGNVYGVLRLGDPDTAGEQDGGLHPDLTPLLAGLALAQALEEAGVATRVKWPNDVLYQGCKVAGILVEERLFPPGSVGARSTQVAGVGVNLAWSPPGEDLRGPEAAPAGNLAAALPGLGPLGLWSLVVARLRALLHGLRGPAANRDAAALVEARLAFLGREVEVRDGPFDKTRGTIVGLTASGALRLSVHGREQQCRSGSVHPVNGLWAE